MNRLELLAEVVERDVLRFTPAGIPIVSLKLSHESSQSEAGIPRQVQFEVSAIAAGEIAGRADRIALGAACRFTGFIARKNRNSKSLVFHIVDFEACLSDH